MSEKHADAVSEKLRMHDLSACEAQEVAKMTAKTLDSIRINESFNLFWRSVLEECKSRGMSEAQLPKKRSAPKRIEECIGGIMQPEFSKTIEDCYRIIYFDALDLVTSCIESRSS